MKGLFLFFIFGLVLLNLIFASWYVINNDINFSSDIARDFLLLQELDEKKLVLIGPRSSVTGLFHGPLWLYLNYPAYLISQGNPVVVGWYWIFLITIFLVSSYFIAKKLFNRLTACLFVLMTSLYLIYHAKGLFNPHGAMFLLPAFFFFFVRFVQALKIRYLITHILIAGLIIQFQMAVGAPFLLLSFIYIAFLTIKQHKKKYLLFFLLILIPLSTFVFFELRHNFILIQSTFRHLGGDPNHNYLFFIADRLRIMTMGTEFLRAGPPNGSSYVSILFFVLLFFQLRQNRFKTIYLMFLYFYIGFFLLSLINKYTMLYFYVFPLFPFAFLIFSSFATSKYKNIFLIIFLIIYAINLTGIIDYLKATPGIIGKSHESWKFLYGVASKIYQDAEGEFGYFVYSPDVLGYQPKYAMWYADKFYNKTAHSFEKRPVTYLVIAPPPSNNPYMKDEWWRINQVNIDSEAASVTKFENGYKIEKYLLDEKQIKVTFDPAINPKIHFR